MWGRLTAIAFMAFSLPALAAPSPVGRWLTEDREGVIEIAPCGANFCGSIVGMSGFKVGGKMPRDVKGRPQCHLEILHDLQLKGTNSQGATTWTGMITNPESGKNYHAIVSVDAAGRLNMRGYIGIPLLGSTQIWTAYTGGLTPDCHLTPAS